MSEVDPMLMLLYKGLLDRATRNHPKGMISLELHFEGVDGVIQHILSAN